MNEVGLWHSIAHDVNISDGFIYDLKDRLDKAYQHRNV